MFLDTTPCKVIEPVVSVTSKVFSFSFLQATNKVAIDKAIAIFLILFSFNFY